VKPAARPTDTPPVVVQRTSSAADWTVDEVVGGFELLAELSRGADSVVYRVRVARPGHPAQGRNSR
jgi:hypothetical protein